jgi:hypothetical protein
MSGQSSLPYTDVSVESLILSGGGRPLSIEHTSG